MITPRQTRLIRVPDLQGFRRAVAAACPPDVAAARDLAVLVPTRAAAEQLRRTLESVAFVPGGAAALVLPSIVTRAGWYEAMHERLGDAPPALGPLEREVVLRAAARDAEASGASAPFRLRPGLIAEILAFYDALKRQRRTIDAFERLLTDDLEPSAGIDRGAERLLRQTRFLAAAFRAYERHLQASGALDEHRLRERLLTVPAARPLRHVLVTVPDRAADPLGLWPVDLDLLARLPGLERVEIVATDALLQAGFHERVHDALPGIEETRAGEAPAPRPALVAPAGRPELFFTARDREEELADAARRLKASRRVDDRRALVFQRPLPYLYLARQVFEEAGIPYQAFDALPLAAEPYAAMLDLVFTFVATGFSRSAAAALARSPLLDLTRDGRPIEPEEAAALDAALREARYRGGYDRLAALAAAPPPGPTGAHAGSARRGRAARALQGVCAAAAALQPLLEPAPPAGHLERLREFLRTHERRGREDERHLRARGAVLGALDALREAHRRHDAAPVAFEELAAAIRRWIEGETFAPRTGSAGLHLLDARAARYGDFDELTVVGLVEGDWPERGRRSIFYPASLLAPLGWPRDQEAIAAARALFADLVRGARRRVALSTFTLEEEAAVGASVLLEELADAGLEVLREPAERRTRIFTHEALTADPVPEDALAGTAAVWLALRRARRPPADAAFHGFVGPRAPRAYAVSAVDRYLDCPFKYFAGRVLELEEERDEEPTMAPQERGRFIHEVFRSFYAAWQQRGGGAVTPETLDEARALFARVAEDALAGLPETDRALERTCLLGSAAAAGLADRVLRLEAERQAGLVDRLLEYPLVGAFDLEDPAGRRRVAIRGVVDRVDLLAGRRFRLFDYKTGRAPRRLRAIQLPVYAACVAQRLAQDRGGGWTAEEAGYVAFGERQPFVSVAGRGSALPAAIADGQARFLAAVDAIERGEFPPRPAETFLCAACAFASVCRKDYVDAG